MLFLTTQVHTEARFGKTITVLFCLYLFCVNAIAQQVSDSSNIVNVQANVPIKAKPYIKPCIYYNHYATPSSRKDNALQYAYAQDNLGFYLPVHTSSWFRDDQVSLASLSFLAGADLVSYRPKLSFVNEAFTINRISLSGKMFYSDGKKSILYVGINPFLANHRYGNIKSYRSLTAAIIYNRTVNRTFAYRLGITNSYTYGVFVPLPVLGMRIGALDKVHFNVQFPRNLSLDIPIGKKCMFSVFAKSMGGIYNVTLQDSLVAATGTDARLVRFEVLRGIQLNTCISDRFSFYIGVGMTSRRRVTFVYQSSKGMENDLIRDKTMVPRTPFVNLGLSLRLGKSKQVYNNTQMYQLFELNTIGKSGDNDTGVYDSDIPADPGKYDIQKINKLKYKDVEDLVTDEY
jgi:hypothetical protein